MVNVSALCRCRSIHQETAGIVGKLHAYQTSEAYQKELLVLGSEHHGLDW